MNYLDNQIACMYSEYMHTIESDENYAQLFEYLLDGHHHFLTSDTYVSTYVSIYAHIYYLIHCMDIVCIYIIYPHGNHHVPPIPPIHYQGG